MEIINIEGKKDLEESLGCQIPVIEVNGKTRFRGIINPVLFERFMKAESRKMTG